MRKRSKTKCVCVLVILVFLSLETLADDAPVESSANRDTLEQDQALVQVREEINNMKHRWYGIMRIRWHDTQLFSAGLGAMLTKQPQSMNCEIGCAISGWHFEIEPGIYGVQGGIGWGKLVGESGSSRLIHTVHFGWNVRGVVLRTWGDSSLYPQSQTLVGVEGSVSIVRMNISMGVLKSLYSGPGEEYGQDWILTTGFGWGF